MVSLNSDIDSPGSDQQEIGERFRPFIETIDGFLHRLEQLPLDRQVISALISTILADSERIVRTGVRSAEQATLAIETLYAAQLAATGTTDSRLETAIDRLHQSLENYSPELFSEELRRIDETLHAEEGL